MHKTTDDIQCTAIDRRTRRNNNIHIPVLYRLVSSDKSFFTHKKSLLERRRPWSWVGPGPSKILHGRAQAFDWPIHDATLSFVLIFDTSSVVQYNFEIVVTKCVLHYWNWKIAFAAGAPRISDKISLSTHKSHCYRGVNHAESGWPGPLQNSTWVGPGI